MTCMAHYITYQLLTHKIYMCVTENSRHISLKRLLIRSLMVSLSLITLSALHLMYFILVASGLRGYTLGGV